MRQIPRKAHGFNEAGAINAGKPIWLRAWKFERNPLQ